MLKDKSELGKSFSQDVDLTVRNGDIKQIRPFSWQTEWGLTQAKCSMHSVEMGWTPALWASLAVSSPTDGSLTQWIRSDPSTDRVFCNIAFHCYLGGSMNSIALSGKSVPIYLVNPHLWQAPRSCQLLAPFCWWILLILQLSWVHMGTPTPFTHQLLGIG